MRRSSYAALAAAGLLALAACNGSADGSGSPSTANGQGKGGSIGSGGYGGYGTASSSGFTTAASSGGSGTTTANGGTGGAGGGSNGRGSHGGSGHTSSSGGHTSSSGASGSSASSTASSGASGSTAASSSSGSSSGTGTTGAGGIFTAPNPWNTPVDADPTSSSSSSVINWLAANGGWGDGAMDIDFSIDVLTATASTPFETFTPTSSFYTPDCDQVPFPVPANGAIEGESGYSCTTGGDCHLIVVDPLMQKLYEMYQADITGGVFNGGCAVVWDLGKSYPPNLRGDGCSSADAGGFPIAAMLFTADEVYANEIPHAIRFILPNPRIRGGKVYVHPGTHTTKSASGAADAPPYGVRFRLRADFPLSSLPSAGAQVVARAMQKYGLFLADGGNIALTAANDAFTTHKWADVDVDAHSLNGIQVTDMEVVDMGTPIPWGSCVRNP